MLSFVEVFLHALFKSIACLEALILERNKCLSKIILEDELLMVVEGCKDLPSSVEIQDIVGH